MIRLCTIRENTNLDTLPLIFNAKQTKLFDTDDHGSAIADRDGIAWHGASGQGAHGTVFSLFIG
ncbi:MAG: hypothetical protein ACI9WC_001845 [Arenicella sp.]